MCEYMQVMLDAFLDVTIIPNHSLTLILTQRIPISLTLRQYLWESLTACRWDRNKDYTSPTWKRKVQQKYVRRSSWTLYSNLHFCVRRGALCAAGSRTSSWSWSCWTAAGSGCRTRRWRLHPPYVFPWGYLYSCQGNSKTLMQKANCGGDELRTDQL